MHFPDRAWTGTMTETDMSRKLTLMMALLGVGLVVAACNTVEGAGKDLSSAGNAISNTAEDVAH